MWARNTELDASLDALHMRHTVFALSHSHRRYKPSPAVCLRGLYRDSPAFYVLGTPSFNEL